MRESALSLEPKDYEKNDRKVDNVQTNRMIEAEVFKYAYKLQDMLAKANTHLNKLDRASADALIERDFLKKPRNNWAKLIGQEEARAVRGWAKIIIMKYICMQEKK